MPTERYSPTHAASTVGISPSTVRAWCLQFQAYLSPDARPDSGKERRLNANDVAILQTVRQLRDEGKSIAEIAAHLAESPTEGLQPFVDASPITVTDQTALQESASNAPALIVAVDNHEKRLALLEGSERANSARRQNQILIFMLGMTAGIVLAVGLLAVAALIMR